MNYKDYEIILPPLEIFLYPNKVKWNWDHKAGKYGDIAVFEFPKEGGMLWYPRKGRHPFPGIPYSVATESISFFKRALFLRLKSFKNPFLLLFFKRFKQELEELAYVSVRHYYLKPEYYCRSVREMYRILKLVGVSEDWTHNICSIFQWDTAYRFMVQNTGQELKKGNPRKEINRLLTYGEAFEMRGTAGMGIKNKWRAVKILFNLLWIIPKFRGIIRKAVKEVNPEEFKISNIDLVYAFQKNV